MLVKEAIAVNNTTEEKQNKSVAQGFDDLTDSLLDF